MINKVGQALGQAPLPVSSPGPDLPLAFSCDQQPAQEEVRFLEFQEQEFLKFKIRWHFIIR